ncbi:hypothetical protein EAS64_42065 [Trebonia kvetii]|uniref:Uncharacterized protein n=1 Tax=Trebonia kvetii TaxID=2480626 RepID=A0A6P2BLQ6_9ACTN|nr:hypothetical protein [Trebonia kvetii]TVY99031.1 hypothetical protein EAS64_42065 [Trebonia kvetii]
MSGGSGSRDARPLFPYPTEVKYAGHGSVKTASSYTPYTPGSAVHKDDYKWAGYPFTSGYEQWCTLTTTASRSSAAANGVASTIALAGAIR